MRYEQTGEEEVDLKTEFSVTLGENESEVPAIMLELFGGSTVGEYYTLTIEEARNLYQSLQYVLLKRETEGEIHGR